MIECSTAGLSVYDDNIRGTDSRHLSAKKVLMRSYTRFVINSVITILLLIIKLKRPELTDQFRFM